MALQWTHRRRVEFSDTDMAGIMHFSNFFRFMESAEHALFRSFGFSVTLKELDPELGLPRVRACCDYRRPLRFEDEVDIVLTVEEVRHKSVHYRFKFYVADGGGDSGPTGSNELAAEGEVTVVCVRKGADGVMKAAAIPEALRRRLEGGPAE